MSLSATAGNVRFVPEADITAQNAMSGFGPKRTFLFELGWHRKRLGRIDDEHYERV